MIGHIDEPSSDGRCVFDVGEVIVGSAWMAAYLSSDRILSAQFIVQKYGDNGNPVGFPMKPKTGEDNAAYRMSDDTDLRPSLAACGESLPVATWQLSLQSTLH